MIITEIKRKGNSETYHVYADNEYFGLIEYDFIYKYNLKEGLELDKDYLLKIKLESDNYNCGVYALKYISKRFCSVYDIRRYLKKLKFSNEGINNAIKKLQIYGYLNDEKWSRIVADNLKSCHGKRYIRQKLEIKGINDEIINKVLEDIDGEEESCLVITKRWLKTHGTPETQNDKAKLYRFLTNKGYSYDIIKNVLQKLNQDAGDLDDWNWYYRSRKN